MNKLEKYILEHSTEEEQVLKDLNRQTHLQILMPRMLSGHLQGKTLEIISQMIQPKNILELGTYTGYSAICLAKGLKENGKLQSIEINDELEEIISEYIEKSDLQDKIEVHFGDAIDIIPKLNETFDLVFIDADKRKYPEYYDLIFDKVKSGGFILADNILWSGKVVEKLQPNDEYTKGILRFNKKVQEDERVENVIFPFRDGIMVIRKK